ncbi:hypothetical protein KIH86_13815 [Paenibacillus sp. HN-1]|uniref:hypothetical protein n=1 Tax=Paenibacillus TaxID=44249 RepID=UPI001CA83B72|nr:MULTISPECIES: hypothetical protein [Paenibacillus]MBY9082392.1 hypothetical protein [Paenibacillus sp. CGMCC 1.18879]MBY9085304.1 hypothetical protein [Paenibacillus sinensis]
MFGYNHYIRVDSGGNVIHAFSDAFEQPQEKDILVADDAERHYNPELWYNAVIPRLRYVDGDLTERTTDELATLWAQYQADHPPQPNEIEQLRIDNAGLLLELAQVQARQDQADADNAAMLLMIVEGGVV